MSIDLQCSRCTCDFSIDPRTPAGATLDRLAEVGPWGCVGDGETLEDSLHAGLCAGESMRCPQCGAVVLLREEELNDIAQQLLVQW